MDSHPVSKPFPGFSHLYSLGETYGGFRAHLDWDGRHADETLALTRAEATPSGPIPLYYRMGRAVPSDVIWTTGLHPVIVHKRVIDLLLDHRFTGWGTYPVEVYGKQGEPYPDYLGLSFTGRCGPIDGSRSERTLVEMPGGLVPHWKGIYFDEQSWDGSDFFMCSDGKGWMFVTEDVVKAFKKTKVRGVTFDSLDSIELMFEPGRKKSG
jgi:hypothetical protein